MYNPGMRRAVLVVLLLVSAPSFAGKLDLDLYSTTPAPKRPMPDYGRFAHGGDYWRPGDPRDFRGESRAVQYLAHAGYAGMAIAGLVGCAATGAVAPAVGFGIVALVHAWQTWALNRSRDARS